MRFLADACVDVRIAQWLRSVGHEVTHLREEGLQRLPNEWLHLTSRSLGSVGLVNAACFFVPGLKYHRQRRRAPPPERPDPASPPPG